MTGPAPQSRRRGGEGDYTVLQAAQFLGLTKQRVRDFIAQGRLETYRNGNRIMIDKTSLESFAKLERRPGRPTE